MQGRLFVFCAGRRYGHPCILIDVDRAEDHTGHNCHSVFSGSRDCLRQAYLNTGEDVSDCSGSHLVAVGITSDDPVFPIAHTNAPFSFGPLPLGRYH